MYSDLQKQLLTAGQMTGVPRLNVWGNVCSAPLLRLQRRVNTQTTAAWQMEPAAVAAPFPFIWAETGTPSARARRDRDLNFRHNYLWPTLEAS